jgi:hypothetical protein
MCVKTALTILLGYACASKSLFWAAKEPSHFSPAQNRSKPSPSESQTKATSPSLFVFFFHPNPLKATVFFSPFCGFFFGQNLLTYRPQSQNLTKSPVFKADFTRKRSP